MSYERSMGDVFAPVDRTEYATASTSGPIVATTVQTAPAPTVAAPAATGIRNIPTVYLLGIGAIGAVLLIRHLRKGRHETVHVTAPHHTERPATHRSSRQPIPVAEAGDHVPT